MYCAAVQDQLLWLRNLWYKHCHPSGSGGVRHRWKSYGLAHFCTSLMSYALCVIRGARGVSSCKLG
nr:MAG TPA: hypothetical protein [Caudoviricetes sp.]DAI53888.1 MAG TPA: hypothetical protein [Caudoviricetes sp.]